MEDTSQQSASADIPGEVSAQPEIMGFIATPDQTQVIESVQEIPEQYSPRIANPDMDMTEPDDPENARQSRDSSPLFVRQNSPVHSNSSRQTMSALHIHTTMDPVDQGPSTDMMPPSVAMPSLTDPSLDNATSSGLSIGIPLPVIPVLNNSASSESAVGAPPPLNSSPNAGSPTESSVANTRPPALSTIARIRSMQDKLRQSRMAARNNAAFVPPQQADPGIEDYAENLVNRSQPSTPNAPVALDARGDESDEADAAEFKRQKKYYDELKDRNGGSLTFAADIEWRRIKRAEEGRRKRVARDKLKAQDDGDDEGNRLFPDTGNPSAPDEPSEESEEDVPSINEPGTTRKRPRPEIPIKHPNTMSLQDAEILSMRVALEANGDLPKKKKRKNDGADGDRSARMGGSSRAQKPKSKAKGSKHTGLKSVGKGGTGSKAKRKSAKQKREQQTALKQVTSLLSGDVFRDQAAQDAADQPTFTSKRKDEALKELLASVPLEKKTQTSSELGVLLAATKDFDGRGSVRADNGLWRVKGMKTSLKAYQIMGTAFMRRRENSFDKPKGGLMADQMGLGKTLMMLANIVNGRPAKGQRKTTLLVAGASLLTQWAEEIKTHTDCDFRVMAYRAGNRLDSNRDAEILGHHDIVLTTYSEVMRSYPKSEPPVELQTVAEKLAWWKKTYEEGRGLLHRMQFYRVVLDEAQAIKNHTSRTSIACRALMADHRWAISGTPILNNLRELYPYFKFLEVPHTGSFQIFKQNYCDPNDQDNTERLLARLTQFMIRRTHKDVMFGAPILKLPKADQSTHWCDFNPVERSIYDIVKTRFAVSINTWSQRGDLAKSYNNVLVMLLRLRQLAGHVLMLQFVMRDLLEREDIERIRGVIKDYANDAAHAQSIVVIRKQLDEFAKAEKDRTAKEEKEREKARKKGVEYVPSVNQGAANETAEGSGVRNDEAEKELLAEQVRQGASGKTFGKSYEFTPYLNSLMTGEHWEKTRKRAKCAACSQTPVNPWVTACHHLYCEECYNLAMWQSAEQGSDLNVTPCKKCGTTFRYAFQYGDNNEFEDPLGYSAPETRSKSKGKKDEQRLRLDKEDIKEDWLSIGGGNILPSAKTIAIKAQIMNWQKENPKVKVIIYTQFISMIRILKKVGQEEGWGCEEYHGKMSFGARDKAIRNFADNDKIQVLLASLRCGGLGLNLTMASRVIVVDPWWNNASEQQAFCRVYRIGQKQPTFMTRFCVRDSVDTRLIEMQDRKRKEIDSVMEDGGKTAKRLDIRDLMRLFGPITEDETGKPFILVDNADPRGGYTVDADDEGFADEL